jgi:hypothetical protein
LTSIKSRLILIPVWIDLPVHTSHRSSEKSPFGRLSLRSLRIGGIKEVSLYPPKNIPMTLSLLALSLLCLAVTPPLEGQATATSGVINGALTPEKIPDEVAWLMLLTSIADGPSSAPYAVRASMLRPLGLSTAEADLVVGAANEAMARIGAMEVEVKRLSLTDEKATQTLIARREAIVRDVAASLQLRLQSDSGVKLKSHLDGNVKRCIQILP